MMDLALGGPSCSKFLLFSIYALAARHVPPNWPEYDCIAKGEPYLSQAKLLLLTELGESKTKIATIQGLFYLSGRQCATGQTSEGWAYLGMAFNLLTDAGLHLCLKKQMLRDGLTPVEMEQRRRLCMAVFTSDKTLCLCLGRPPSITNLPESLEGLLDDFEDEEMWSTSAFPAYPAQRGYTTACYRQFYKLCGMVPMIFSNLSLAGRNVLAQSRTTTLLQQLQDWYDSLPIFLRMAPIDASTVCPPPHILSLNLFYHTLRILAWRSSITPTTPRHTHQQAIRDCVEQSEMMHQMFMLYGTTFNWSNMTYLTSYCVYIAASVDVAVMSSLNAEVRARAAVRLGIALRLLEGEVKQTPGVKSSVNILKNRLETIGMARGDETADLIHASPATQGNDIRATLAAKNPPNPAEAMTTCEHVMTSVSPIHSFPPDTIHNPGFQDQMQQQPFLDTWDLSLTDLGAGFQPDSFGWDLDESLQLPYDWWRHVSS
jgi:hypothetical protein